MSRLPYLLALAAITLVISAHAVTVRLSAADGSRVQVSLHPGDILRIDLPAEPATGRLWTVHRHIPAQLTELGASQRIFGGRLSNQGISSFAWRALAAGEGELTLVYGTPSARAGTPEKTYVVHLAVAGEPLGPEEAHPQPVSQVELVAIYNRKQPCGDCSALTERLLLYRGSGESPCVLKRTYQGAPGGTLTSVTTGSWATHPGNSADPSATVYEVSTGNEASLFLLQGDRLVQVDAQQVPIPSPPDFDTAFHKVTNP